MRGGSRRAALLLAFAALAAGSLGVMGCGDDEDSGEEVTIPEISTPTETTPAGTTTTPESGGVAPEDDTGGTSPESGGGGTGTGTTTTPDSSSNDTPPAAGSPEEAFEKACKQTPEICQ